jgi:hypothetical protein
MKEPEENIYITCHEHASHPDPALHNFPPDHYVGQFVKLAFEAKTEQPEQQRTEHLWVKVMKPDKTPGFLHGEIWNDPIFDVGCKNGDAILFAVTEIEEIYAGAV